MTIWLKPQVVCHRLGRSQRIRPHPSVHSGRFRVVSRCSTQREACGCEAQPLIAKQIAATLRPRRSGSEGRWIAVGALGGNGDFRLVLVSTRVTHHA